MTARVLLLGGLDPSGGAGITLDASVVALHGLEPLPVAVALTVQGRRGFRAFEPVPRSLVEAQLRAVLDDGPVQAVKVGFVGDAATLATIAGALAALDSTVPLVVDPVLSATAGGLGPSAALARAYAQRLVPRATLVTPNVPELAALAGGDVRLLLEAGAAAVLVKGGHRDGQQAIDELHGPSGTVRFARPRRACGPVRGTGCALASAITARLASAEPLAAACEAAGDWLSRLLACVTPRPDGLPQVLPLAAAR